MKGRGIGGGHLNYNNTVLLMIYMYLFEMETLNQRVLETYVINIRVLHINVNVILGESDAEDYCLLFIK